MIYKMPVVTILVYGDTGRWGRNFQVQLNTWEDNLKSCTESGSISDRMDQHRWQRSKYVQKQRKSCKMNAAVVTKIYAYSRLNSFISQNICDYCIFHYNCFKIVLIWFLIFYQCI